MMDRITSDETTGTTFVSVLAAVFAVALTVLALRWRNDAQRRLDAVRSKGPLAKMVRVPGGTADLPPSALAAACASLDLRDGYAAQTCGGVGGVAPPGRPPIGIASLREYLSSLRPADSDSGGSERRQLVREEVDALLSRALLRALGPRLGAAILPALGGGIPGGGAAVAALTDVAERSFLPTVAEGGKSNGDGTTASSSFTLSEAAISAASAALDAAYSGISVLQIVAASDTAALAAQARRRRREDDNSRQQETESERGEKGGSADPISLMKQGETHPDTFPESILTNPFDMTARNVQAAIQHILERERNRAEESGESFDPDALTVNIPKPIHDDLLPGLHIGFGGAVGTHTHREIARNRLFSVLLNRLAANDVLPLGERRFAVRIAVRTGEGVRAVYRPCGLVGALRDAGHTVLVRPRLNVLSFGIGLCYKEVEKSSGEPGSADRWTNIPIGILLRSGYEDERGEVAHSFLTHGGIDFDIEPPNDNDADCRDAGGSERPFRLGGRVSLQHFQAIDGFTGWHSNHNTNVPWLSDRIYLDEWRGNDADRAVRLAGLAASVLNSTAFRLRLPRGGYGLTGVCLDSTAVVQCAMKGRTDIYPLLSVGRFHAHAVREAGRFRRRIEEEDPAEGRMLLAEFGAIRDAMVSLPSDALVSTSGAADAARQMLCSTPPSKPFGRMAKSEQVLQRIIDEHSGP